MEVANCDIQSGSANGSTKRPYAFTEHGAIMAATCSSNYLSMARNSEHPEVTAMPNRCESPSVAGAAAFFEFLAAAAGARIVATDAPPAGNDRFRNRSLDGW